MIFKVSLNKEDFFASSFTKFKNEPDDFQKVLIFEDKKRLLYCFKRENDWLLFVDGIQKFKDEKIELVYQKQDKIQIKFSNRNNFREYDNIDFKKEAIIYY